MDLGWLRFQPSGSSGLAGIGWDFFLAILIYSFVFQFFLWSFPELGKNLLGWAMIPHFWMSAGMRPRPPASPQIPPKHQKIPVQANSRLLQNVLPIISGQNMELDAIIAIIPTGIIIPVGIGWGNGGRVHQGRWKLLHPWNHPRPGWKGLQTSRSHWSWS